MIRNEDQVADASARKVSRASRREFLAVGGVGSIGVAAAVAAPALWNETNSSERSGSPNRHVASHSMGGLGTVGDVAPDQYFNPVAYLTTWNHAPMPAELPRRDGWDFDQFYRETMRENGTRLREYQFVAVDREIEIAPGLYFPAWTYNFQVPGPTIRATQGDHIRIRFVNQGSHPHTMHFHGWHTSAMDGAFPSQFVGPGDEFIYEFDADPVGLHLYHCHSVPLKRHIHKGLYGVSIVDPDPKNPEYAAPELQRAARSRNPDYAENRQALELVMMMNAFDTDFDADNEVYAVNSVAFHFMRHPIPVPVGQLVRVYLVNITEFDLINSFHLHAGFFDVFRTGTKLVANEHSDTVMLCQAERAILEFRLRWPGQYMFHAHQSEFAELGWMGAFDATDSSRPGAGSPARTSNYAAPDFSLVDADGRPVKLGDFLGRSNLLLVFSQGDSCEHCTGQVEFLANERRRFESDGTQILIVSPAPPKVTRANGVRQAGDSTGDAFRSFGVNWSGKVRGHGVFLMDRSGVVRWENIGDEPFMDSAVLWSELERLRETTKRPAAGGASGRPPNRGTGE